MLERMVLGCADRVAPLIRRLGVDYPQFRAIVQLRLTLDERRNALQAQPTPSTRKSDGTSGALGSTVFIYTIMGLLVAASIFKTDSILLAMTIVNSFVMLMLAVSLIADFTSVLFDPTDITVLYPRPVSGRTVFAARLAHVIAYLSIIALSLAGPTLLLGLFRVHPLFPPVFLLTLIGAVILVVCGVNAFYLLAMRVVNPDRFRDVILYFQVGMMVMVVLGYQVLPRLMTTSALADLSIDDAWAIYFWPPAWLAGPIELLFGDGGGPAALLTVLAVLAPAAAMLLVLRVLAPRFNQAMARMHEGAGRNRRRPAGLPRRTMGSRLAAWAGRGTAERASFELIWLLCSRDREFKLRAYTPLAVIAVITCIMLLGGGRMDGREAASLADTQLYLFVLYFLVAIVGTLAQSIRYTAQSSATWVYHALPIPLPGTVMIAAVKVILLRFGAPALLILSPVCVVIWGASILPDIVLAAVLMALVAIIDARAFGRSLPFARAFSALDASRNFGKGLITLIVPAALGVLHYAMTFAPPAVVLAIPAALLATWFAGRQYARTTWDQLLPAAGP